MRNRKRWRIPMLSLTNEKEDAKAYVPKDFEDWREIPSTALERVEVRDALVKALSSRRSTTGRHSCCAIYMS
jgi:hypothetical protein